jgi:hypothetical protein
MKNFNELVDTFKKSNLKFALVIGAGFHHQFLDSPDPKFNKLKQWPCLLDFIKKKAKASFTNSTNSILDFEKIIIDYNRIHKTKKIAYLIENKLLGDIKEEFKQLTNDSDLKIKSNVLSIFNHEIISDVLNLNFDLIVEKKFAEHTLSKSISKYPKKMDLNKKTDDQYRKINGIRFWHPHGDITNSSSMVLGLRKYGLQIKKLEKFRNNYKANGENKLHNFIEKNWMEVIMNKPLIIIGASLNQNEQDILFAIVNKKRNFIKSNDANPDHRSYVFQMLGMNEKSNLGELAIPLFPNTNFDDQWKKLIKLFSQDDI